MARQNIDTTGNEAAGNTFAKIQAMLIELYAAAAGVISGAITGTTLAVTGAITGASVAVTGAVTGATATLTGLITGNTLKVDTGTKTAAATAGAATLAKAAGKITSEALTTAAGAVYTLTITNSQIAAADQAFASLANGTNSAGEPVIETVTPGASSLIITVRNRHAADALNGTLVISFISLKN